jgi:hypothetical protein
MAVPYIGKMISLISKSNIRYTGTLYSLNTNDKTVGLSGGRERCHLGSLLFF